MRDFLYKVWHKELKRFADNIVELGDSHVSFKLDNGKNRVLPIKSNKLIKLQYTNIDDDINNTKIFEGDIIEILEYKHSKKDYQIHLSDIVWDEDCFLTIDYGDSYYSNPLCTYPYKATKFPVSWIKVVGNIYENQDLFEQLKKNNIIK